MTTTVFERQHFFTRLIWLFPLVYIVHILEESNGFADWVTHTLGGQMSSTAFFVNNAIFWAINSSLCWLAMRQQKRWSTALLFFWMGGQEFWNFMFHMYAEFRFNTYSPGYFTAILLYLPVYTYLSYICLREKFIVWPVWLLTFGLSVTGMAFTIWAGLYHFQPIPWHKWL